MKSFKYIGILLLGVALGGFLFSGNIAAGASQPISQTALERLYDGMFHRPLDAGAYSYVGFDIDFVLDQLLASEEQGFYTGVFSAVKKIEDAHRSSDTTYRDNFYGELSGALGSLESWAAGYTITAPDVGGIQGAAPAEIISPRTATATTYVESFGFYNPNASASTIYNRKVGEIRVSMLCPTSGPIQYRSIRFDVSGAALSYFSNWTIDGLTNPTVTITGNSVEVSSINVYEPTVVCGDRVFDVMADFNTAGPASLGVTWPSENVNIILPAKSIDLFERRDDVSPSDAIYYRWERMLVSGT